MKNGVSKVYTDRPDYADFDSPAKFEAIKSIIAKRLIEHPDAICSYSGGSDSDIMLDLIERTRAMFELPPIKYVFFNTGLEMKATRDHVKYVAKKYGVEIEERRPEINIVRATRSSDQDKVYPFRAFWNGINFTDGCRILDVIAWMPLPEPYKEKTE